MTFGFGILPALPVLVPLPAEAVERLEALGSGSREPAAAVLADRAATSQTRAHGDPVVKRGMPSNGGA